MSKPDGRHSATRIVLLYFLGAGTWILGSDLALLAVYPDSASTVIGSLVKGGLFVVFTSALLYYVLKKRPAAETPAELVGRAGDSKIQGRWPALIPFMLLTVALVSVCAWLFVREQHEHREFAHQQLESQADIKARELGLWLKDQSQSAQSYGRARSFQEDLPNILRGDRDALARVEKRLEEVRQSHEVDTILVLDPAGRTLVVVGNQRNVSADLARDVAEVAQKRKPRFHVLRRARDESGAPVVLDQIVPVDLDSAAETAPAVFVLRDDAASTLFTMVRYWPVENRTGEVYLVRRAGDRIEYLSELKAKHGAPLTPGASAASEERVSAQLIRGAGFTEKAVDYRGVAVLAASRAVPGTDWQVVAKMDLAEVLEPVRDQAQVFLILIVSLTLFTAYGATRLWRQHMQLVALRARAEIAERKRAENQLSAAEERYRALFDRSLDCIFLSDLEGNFLDANRAALDLLGYRRDEIPSISYRTLLDPADLPRALAALQEVIRTGSQRDAHEYRLRRKDGGQVIIESKTALVYAGDQPSAILGIARDITERTRQQARIARLTRIRDTLSAVNRAIVHADTENVLYGVICDIAIKHGAFVAAWIGVPDADSGMVLPLKSAGTPAALDYMRRLRISFRDVPEGRGPTGIAAREGRTVVSNDFLGEDSNAPWHDAARAVGIRSIASIPLRRRGAIAAVLTVYAGTTHYFDSEFISLLEEMAGDVSFSLDVLAGDLERRRSQQDLEYKNVVLSTQQETSPDAILLVNAEGRIVSYNHHFLELWNIPEAMASAGNDEPVLRAVTGQMQNQEEFIQKIKHLYDNKDELSHDELQTKDGRFVDRHSAPLFGGTGEYFGRVWYFRDISQRVKSEEARARLAAIVEASSDAIVSRGIDGKIQTWNAAAEHMFGWTEQEAVGQPIGIIVPAERSGELRPVIDRVVAGENPGAIESTHLRKDGSRIDTSITLSVIRDAKGDARAVSLMYRDITERKQAEAALHETEQRFRAMIEQSISGFYMIQDDTFTYVNARFTEIFGYASANEIVGKPPSELVAPRDRATVAGNIQRRLAGEMKSISYSFTGVRKDGSEIEVGVHGSFATYGGRPVIMGLLQDISERKRAEEEIKRYVARLEQAMQSTINVVATIGELRDPYTHGHERRVGEIAAAIGTEMGLDPNQVEGIRIAGYMHDVGKIGVPAEILAKPARLTKAEFELVKDHAQQSYEILKTVPFPWPVAEAAWQHHERIDGSGYPRGLKGMEIIVEARVLAVADTVEAMSSHRPYRPGLGIDRALAEIEKNRGRLYDPDAVDACVRLFREKDFTLPT